jgi:hypothetical protein
VLEACTHPVVALLARELVLVERQHRLQLGFPTLVQVDVLAVLFEVGLILGFGLGTVCFWVFLLLKGRLRVAYRIRWIALSQLELYRP